MRGFKHPNQIPHKELKQQTGALICFHVSVRQIAVYKEKIHVTCVVNVSADEVRNPKSQKP